MGMSASQARFLCLTARKNNVEFEGQQINQQRTTLSNESASYYSELCNMAVPIPPSIDDYTKVTYTFNDGAMTNTVTSLLFSSNDNSYHLNYIQQWQDDYAIVPSSSALVMKENGGYSVGSDKLLKMGATSVSIGTNASGVKEYTFKTPIKNASGAITGYSDNKITEQDLKQYYPYYASLEDDQLNSVLETEQYYIALLRENCGKADAEFYVKYAKNTTTGNYVPYFYMANELESASYTDRNLASVSCTTLGSEIKTKEVLNQKCSIEQDSSGRYVAITIEYQNGTKTEEKTYQLTTTTSTDEAAYNDAMNDYYYQQHQYDHKIQEINSRLEIIQQQDKQLELKLKQLDTEENAISTEMDAVKKVISKNVDSSFKTFSA